MGGNKLEKERKVATLAIKKAGKVSLENFRKETKVREKEFKELVSNVDLKSEEIIIHEIKKNFPDHGITSEELGTEGGQEDYTWIIDPLDGTHNYIYGQPAFGISIALAHEREVIMGLIYMPFYDELFYAEKNNGAYCNRRQIRVSNRDKLSEAYILYDPQLHKRKDMFDNLRRVSRKSFTLRIIGCAVSDASSVATGRADARVWHNTKITDVAAGTLLVKEAGGKVTDFSGNPYKLGNTEVLASNGKIHDELISILGQPKGT